MRVRRIVVEEFKQQEGKPPNELELLDLLKMVVVPFGILKQQNGSSHFQTPQIPAQKQTQAPEQNPKIDLVKDIVKDHPELSIEGDKIVMRQFIKPTDVFYIVKDQLAKKGWNYVNPKHTGGSNWEPGYFEFREGAKA